MTEADAQPTAPFSRVVCGIDTSPQSLEALRQAVSLAASDARIYGVSVWDPGEAMLAGIHASEVSMNMRRDSARALDNAVQSFPQLDPILMRGRDATTLLAAAANLEADLVSVGAHGRSRAAGIAFGSVATAMAHYASCSVLVARAIETGSFPSSILHASDGSPEALDAARIAGQIAAANRSTVVTLHVADHDLERGRAIAEASVALIDATGSEPVTKVVTGSASRKIVEFAAELGAGLIVVGSRGLTGVSALGSVSERVAHHAPCSVLIVRPTAHPVRDDHLPAEEAGSR
jgi:nucleotide-binding universal stress UspA family protein